MRNKQIVRASAAPAAIGPYSQATSFGGLIFVSGQIPLTPAGELVEGGIAEQTRQVLENLRAVLFAGGSGLAQVLKTTVYLQDMNEFQEMNRVYAEFFSSRPPARATVEVSRLPRDVRVEIDAIAFR